MIQIGEEEYTILDSFKLMQNYNLTQNAGKLYEKLYDESFTMTNPEIPMIIVFTGTVATANFFKYGDDFKDKIKLQIYPRPLEVQTTVGDGTVPAYSTLIPGFKWAYEFDNESNQFTNYQPIKFVEYCGVGYTFKSIYDSKPTNQPYEIKQNEYMGVNCDCNFQQHPRNYNKCSHAAMHSDSNIIRLVYQVAVANQRAPKEALEAIQRMDPFVIEASIVDCNHITPGLFS